MLGAILGEIRTCWPRIHHIWMCFELLSDAYPWFLPFCHQTKLFHTFPDRFKKYSSISEDPLEN